MYLYSIYYFFFKTKMFGLFQTSFYFGYSAMFALVLGVLCGLISLDSYTRSSHCPLTGAFGYVGTDVFVRQIYRLVKID